MGRPRADPWVWITRAMLEIFADRALSITARYILDRLSASIAIMVA